MNLVGTGTEAASTQHAGRSEAAVGLCPSYNDLFDTPASLATDSHRRHSLSSSTRCRSLLSLLFTVSVSTVLLLLLALHSPLGNSEMMTHQVTHPVRSHLSTKEEYEHRGRRRRSMKNPIFVS